MFKSDHQKIQEMTIPQKRALNHDLITKRMVTITDFTHVMLVLEIRTLNCYIAMGLSYSYLQF